MNLDELTDFADWTDVRLSLARWAMAQDARRSLVLVRSENHVHVYEPPDRWRARDRRELHRLGFRPRRPPRGGRAWEWTVPAQLVEEQVSTRIAGGSATASVLPELLRLERRIVTDRLLLDRAMKVLRDVFRLQPGDITIAVLDEDLEP